MGEQIYPDDLSHTWIEHPYTEYETQQHRETSWQGPSEPYGQEDMQFSNAIPIELGNSLSIDHGDTQAIISDLANVNDQWDYRPSQSQTQTLEADMVYDTRRDDQQYDAYLDLGPSSAIPQFVARYDRTIDNGQGAINDVGRAHTESVQSPTSINQPLLLTSSEPWNPLHVSCGLPGGHNQILFHSSGTSSQLSSSQIPSHRAVSPGSSGLTWTSSNTSYRFKHPKLTDNTNTVQNPQIPGNLARNSRRKSQASPGHLAVHDDTASMLSETPNHVAGVLYCQHEGCGQKFTGTHRRGTLHRHMRLKHMPGQGAFKQEKRYSCQVEDCGKDFMRQDARLKHYRNKHPELGTAAPKSRKQGLQ
jgi:hypothetical protein